MPSAQAIRMIGDLVYECKGRIVSMRVKENGDAEYTAVVEGTIRGERFTSTFSWDARFRPDGSGYGEIRGFFNTVSGETGRFTGIGNGFTQPDGAQVYMGALCYSNPPGKYADLNRMAVAYDVGIDKDGNFMSKGWAWSR